jgi:hypothetical protein
MDAKAGSIVQMAETTQRRDFRSYRAAAASQVRELVRDLVLSSSPDEGPIERGRPDLLVQLVNLCARSYKWTPASFKAEMRESGRTHFAVFQRCGGPWSWRLAALFCMPLSATLLPFLFAFTVVLLLAVASADLSVWSESNGSVLRSAVWLAAEAGSMLARSAEWASEAIRKYSAAAQGWLPAWIGSMLVAAIGYASGTGIFIARAVQQILFWIPAGVQSWMHGHAPSWLELLAIEIRGLFGLTLLLGLLIAVVLLVIPRYASARAFGIVDPGTNRVIIVLCGSQFIDNFTINAGVWLYRKPLRHFGFHRAWKHIAADVRDWLDDVLAEGGEIILTGHSLGGALAEVAAFDLAGRYPVSFVAAFGSSRIGGPDMRALYEERRDCRGALLHERTWHITHSDDTVPRLPPNRHFVHVGKGYLLSNAGHLREGQRGSIYDSYFRLVDRGVGLSGPLFGFSTVQDKTAVEADPANPVPEQRDTDAGPRPLLRDNPQLGFLTGALARLIFYTLGAFGYHGRVVMKGLSRDHKMRLYRDALQKRAALLAEQDGASGHQ